jgi:hypothetical protein
MPRLLPQYGHLTADSHDIKYKGRKGEYDVYLLAPSKQNPAMKFGIIADDGFYQVYDFESGADGNGDDLRSAINRMLRTRRQIIKQSKRLQEFICLILGERFYLSA